AIVQQTQAARRDPAGRLHRRGLDAQHRRDRPRQTVDVSEVPVVGRPVHGRILAHQRHHDAVGERKAAQLDRGKQSAHVEVSGCEENRFPRNVNRRGNITNCRVQSSSVNCSNNVRWIIEKLSSETMLSTVSPSGVTWASMPSMLSISSPKSASKIEGPSTSAPGAIVASAILRTRMPTPSRSENFRS